MSTMLGNHCQLWYYYRVEIRQACSGPVNELLDVSAGAHAGLNLFWNQLVTGGAPVRFVLCGAGKYCLNLWRN